MSRKSRSRSQSEPIVPDSIRRRQGTEAEGKEEEDNSWSGTLRSMIWSLWPQSGSLAAVSEDASGMSSEEANLSEYEEEIRKNRVASGGITADLSNESNSPSTNIPISEKQRERKASTATSPVVSPKQDNQPFLDVADYGISLEDPENHDHKQFIMTSDLISKLHSGLPSRWRIASKWTLLYSTEFHGFSLSTMFARSKSFSGPVICAIKDTNNDVFGAFATQPFAPHIGHFGTGECFLWKVFEPGRRVRRFRSTGLNDYLMMCESGFLAVGCGEGKFGLWIDAQFENGHSHAVPTFDNEPLSRGEHFECVTFELWGLLCEDY